MKRFEKLLLYLIPIVIVGICVDTFTLSFTEKFFKEKIEQEVLPFYFLLPLMSLFSKQMLINISISIWLWLLVKKKNTRYALSWSVIGLFFGFLGLILFLITEIFYAANNSLLKERTVIIFGNLLLPLVFIIPLLSIAGIILAAPAQQTTENLKSMIFFANENNLTLSTLVLMVIPPLPKITATIWIAITAKRATNYLWLWCLATFFMGIIPIIILSLFVVAEADSYKTKITIS